MLSKNKEKEKAITLRKQGFSYSEILKEVPVAKSSLSLWLQSVGLSKKQKQRLTEKKLASMKRGWEACHNKKITVSREIIKRAEKEIEEITERELWLIGISLYWGEGHKEKHKASGVRFTNSDPKMIILFLKWLDKICKIPKGDISFEIYLHESAKNREEYVKKYWQKVVGFSSTFFSKTRWKKNKINTKRKNIGEEYLGLLRISVKKSTNFNRKIQGWINGICQHCRVV